MWNRAELTLRCLRALCEQSDVPIEVVLVDNQSTDDTSALLDRIVGAKVVRNATNLGFTMAANFGAHAATGTCLLFLNNDAEIMPGSLQHLLAAVGSNPSIGAVGGKLVFPDGRLQEAGAIVWSMASATRWSRGDPEAPEFNFRRDVDYCSGAFLLTRRDLFDQLGGFDERYRPAYYEDLDYCTRLWESGYRVVYEPLAVAVHFEFASSASSADAVELQQERRPLFVARHGQWLASQRSRTDGFLAARTHPHGRPSVLVIDDAWPNPRLGSGYPRAAALLCALVDLDCSVTLYPMDGAGSRIEPDGDLRGVEIVREGGLAHLQAFLESRRTFDAVIISRPHNLRYVKAAVGSDLSALGAPVIYDAEAVYALRDIERGRLAGTPPSTAAEQSLIDQEIGLARGCAAVLAVSESKGDDSPEPESRAW